MCRIIPWRWRSLAATPPAIGRSAISGDHSATRRAPGSITSQPAPRRFTPRRSKRASTWKRPSRSSARQLRARRCACRCRWRSSTADLSSFVPAQASGDPALCPWIPAFAGMSGERELRAGAALDVGDAFRHAELATADLGEHADALADRLHGGTGETKPQPALAVGLVGRPIRSRVDGDAGGERGLREFWRVDRVGKLDPQEDAALRLVEL